MSQLRIGSITSMVSISSLVIWGVCLQIGLSKLTSPFCAQMNVATTRLLE